MLPTALRPVGPCPANIMIVGEFPSEADTNTGMIFCGSGPGAELGRMLQDAGILKSSCFQTAFLRERPSRGDVSTVIAQKKADIQPGFVIVRDKHVAPSVAQALELLSREIELCRPSVIIALGNAAMWALTGEWGITSWRGSVLQSDLPLALDYRPKVIPVFPPGLCMAKYEWRPQAVHDLKRALKESRSRELIRPNYEFIIRPDYSTALSVLDQLFRQLLRGPVKLAVDIETRAGHISCLGIAWSKTHAICLPFMCVERPAGYWSEQEEPTILFALSRVLQHPNAVVIGQNFHYDIQYIQRFFCFTPRLARDTMIANHTMFPGFQKSLAFLASMYCEHYAYWKDDGKGWDPSIPEEQYWTYNCMDCVYTFEVDEAQQRVVDQVGKREIHDFQQALFWPVLRSMNRGVRISQAKRNEFLQLLFPQIQAHQAFLADVLGYELNVGSPPQMQDLVYRQFNLPKQYSRSSGGVTCDDEALNKLAAKEPLFRPIATAILELRSLTKFLSTYVMAKLDIDGRMRCSFSIAGTETFRFSSSANPFGSGANLQNIPAGN